MNENLLRPKSLMTFYITNSWSIEADNHLAGQQISLPYMDPEGLFLFAKELITKPLILSLKLLLPYGQTYCCRPICAYFSKIIFFVQII
jgi:hypothetical protein